MRRTVRVRIAVAVDPGGEWNANGWGGRGQPCGPEAMSMARECVGDGAAGYWIEAELPVPDPEVPGEPRVVPGDVRVEGREDPPS